ncbi:MAG: restriction endonuclease [Methanoregula sp.]
MTLWLVRAGKHGERESLALSENIAVIGWEELPDLTPIQSREQLGALLKKIDSNEKLKTLIAWEAQIWPFIHDIKKGDLIALPFKSRAVILIGEVLGDYQYRPDLPPDAKHTRPVKWKGEFSRTQFDKDILLSLGAAMTVCRIQRNHAEERVRALISGKKVSDAIAVELKQDEISNEETAYSDVEQLTRDQIREYISQKFKGHKLENLVAAILVAQGYQVKVSPEGPDGGVDIIAGRGPLGFDAPRIAVQVKSQDAPIDIKIFHELQGVIKNFGADQGLLVAWGGYKSSVAKESIRHFFEIRLWDAEDLVRMIQTHYEDLPDDIQAELPLKRIWALVLEEE